MSFRIIFSAFIFANLFSLGCASQQMSPSLNEEIKATSPAPEHGRVAARVYAKLNEAKHLSEEQKQKIVAVHEKTYNDIMTIRQELSQAHTVLLQKLFSKNRSTWDLNELKTRIVDLNNRKVDIMLRTFDEVSAILGPTYEDENFFRDYFDFDHWGPAIRTGHQ